MTNNQKASIESAREFAVSAHGNQKYGDEPYSVHLDDVARTVAELGFSGDELQIIAMLHDVLEDTEASRTEIGARFGSRVLQSVEQLTRVHKNWGEILYFSSMDERAFAVKLADRLSNVRALGRSGAGSANKHRKLLQKYDEEMMWLTIRVGFGLGDRYRKATALVEEAISAAAVRLGVDELDSAKLRRELERRLNDSFLGDGPVKSVNEGETYSVLVLDMNYEDRQTVGGFKTLEAATEYARNRVKASVDELRKPGQTLKDLTELYYLYGESASVIEASVYFSITEILAEEGSD